MRDALRLRTWLSRLFWGAQRQGDFVADRRGQIDAAQGYRYGEGILENLFGGQRMKKEIKSKGIPLDEIRLERLRDPKRAGYALKLALQEFEKDANVDILLDTLRLVAQAQGGLAELARRASVSRQALHEALSSDGNPRLRTFQSVLDGLGLRMSFKTFTRHPLVVR